MSNNDNPSSRINSKNNNSMDNSSLQPLHPSLNSGINVKTLILSASLPRWEVGFYVMFVVTAASGLVYACYVKSSELRHLFTYKEVGHGWHFLNRNKDISDSEWYFWTLIFEKHLWKWYIGHLVVGQMFKSLFSKGREYFLVVFGSFCLSCVVGIRSVVVIVGQTTFMYLVAHLTATPACIWMAAVGFKASTDLFLRFGVPDDRDVYERILFEYCLMLTVMRTTSGGLVICEQLRCPDQTNKSNKLRKLLCDTVGKLKIYFVHMIRSSSSAIEKQINSSTKLGDNQDESEERSQDSKSDLISDVSNFDDFKHFLCYVSYLPLLFAGPILLFDEFQTELYNSNKAKTFRSALKGILRVIATTFCLELSLHYLYSSAMLRSPARVSDLDPWTLFSVGYVTGQMFMVKYLIIFTLGSTTASFDQIHPPGRPKCISRIYQYSEMWKHIYIPLGGSRNGIRTRFLASSACFLFVFIHHGSSWFLMWWALYNFIAAALESFADYAVTHLTRTRGLSAPMSRRLWSLINVPIIVLSTSSTFVFLSGGTDSVSIMAYKLLIEQFPINVPVIALCSYCFTQTGIEVSRWELRKSGKDRSHVD